MGRDNDLESSLEATPAERGPAMIALRESQWFERKSARVAPRQLGETLCAFANAEGGTVVVGIHDGRVEGINRQGRPNEWRQAGLDHCEPPVKVSWREVECIRADGQSDVLLLGEVPPSPLVHATVGGDVYLRVGDENRRLSFVQRQELLYDKGQAQFDGTVVADASLDDLDEQLVSEYAATIQASEPRRALEARGLVTSGGHVSAAAWLLFGRHPQAQMPSAYVRVVRYRGRTRETGSRQQIVADERCEGPIPLLLERARSEIERVEPKRRVLGPEGRFILQSLIPHDAWLEGVVNAVVHRSYSLGGDHIRIEVFDDRMEITSPGSFPGLTSASRLPDVTRFARNPRIARACADLQFGQELGEGIRRMFQEMRTRGLSDPLYQTTQASVRLVLTSLVADGKVLGQFNPEYLRIMDVLRHGQRLGTGDIAEALRVTRPTAISRLTTLRDLGFIEWVGKSPRDPRAHWRLRSE